MVFPDTRPRRLRRTPALRRLVAETVVAPHQLVLPLFVREGATDVVPIGSMPGVVQHTRDTLKKAASDAVAAGLGGVMLFGIPEEKDATGSAAPSRTNSGSTSWCGSTSVSATSRRSAGVRRSRRGRVSGKTTAPTSSSPGAVRPAVAPTAW